MARWINVEFKNITTYYLYRYSECDHPESFKHKHCPNCGERMDGKEE